MALFPHRLPPAFFRPLAAPGAPVYADILLTLYEEAIQRHEPFSRQLALDVVRSRLTEGSALADTADISASEAEALQPDIDVVSIRAHGILRHFEACGWLRPDTQADYTTVYFLTEPAFYFLRAIHEWLHQTTPPLAGLFSAIHDTLRAAVQDGDYATRIPQAHQQTEQLRAGLQSLYQNMGEHLNALLQEQDVRAILEQWFTHYRSNIIAPAYHALRTTAHIGRYRQGALEALHQLLANTEKLHAAARDLVARRQAETAEGGSQRLRDQLLDIQRTLNDLDDRLRALDERHATYISAASRAVRLRLAAHTTLSGQLNALLKMALARPEFAETAANRLNRFALRLPNADSLAPPRRQATPFVPSAAADPDPAEVQKARADTQRELQRAFSPNKVRQRVQAWLADQPRRAATEFPLHSPADLPWLIYIRAYGANRLGYHVEETAEWVQVGAFQFRQFFVVKDTPHDLD